MTPRSIYDEEWTPDELEELGSITRITDEDEAIDRERERREFEHEIFQHESGEL